MFDTDSTADSYIIVFIWNVKFNSLKQYIFMLKVILMREIKEEDCSFSQTK